MYGRVDLSKVEYKLDKDIIHHKPTLQEATEVFHAYCIYKKFKSVYPLYQDDINIYDWNCLYENGKARLHTMDRIFITPLSVSDNPG